MIPALTAILALLAAIGGAYVGAATANAGAATNQQALIDEERAKVDRDRRAQVYVDFLASANDYRRQVRQASICLATGVLVPSSRERNSAAIPQDIDSEIHPEKCASLIDGFDLARNAFQNARNAVFYYGSQEAELVASLIAEALPEATGSYSISDASNYDPRLFDMLYVQFNAVVCRDVQTDLDRRCG